MDERFEQLLAPFSPELEHLRVTVPWLSRPATCISRLDLSRLRTFYVITNDGAPDTALKLLRGSCPFLRVLGLSFPSRGEDAQFAQLPTHLPLLEEVYFRFWDYGTPANNVQRWLAAGNFKHLRLMNLDTLDVSKHEASKIHANLGLQASDMNWGNLPAQCLKLLGHPLSVFTLHSSLIWSLLAKQVPALPDMNKLDPIFDACYSPLLQAGKVESVRVVAADIAYALLGSAFFTTISAGAPCPAGVTFIKAIRAKWALVLESPHSHSLKWPNHSVHHHDRLYNPFLLYYLYMYTCSSNLFAKNLVDETVLASDWDALRSVMDKLHNSKLAGNIVSMHPVLARLLHEPWEWIADKFDVTPILRAHPPGLLERDVPSLLQLALHPAYTDPKPVSSFGDYNGSILYKILKPGGASDLPRDQLLRVIRKILPSCSAALTEQALFAREDIIMSDEETAHVYCTFLARMAEFVPSACIILRNPGTLVAIQKYAKQDGIKMSLDTSNRLADDLWINLFVEEGNEARFLQRAKSIWAVDGTFTPNIRAKLEGKHVLVFALAPHRIGSLRAGALLEQSLPPHMKPSCAIS